MDVGIMKGVLFTAIALLAVMPLIILSAVFAQSNLERKSDINMITSSDRLSYAFDQLDDSIFKVIGIGIEESGYTLNITDRIPRQDYLEFLLDYESFATEILSDATMNIVFNNTNGSLIDWNDVKMMMIEPTMLTYRYMNSTNNDIVMESADINSLSHLERLNVTVNTTGVNILTSDWSSLNTCVTLSNPDCIEFRLILNATVNSWDSGELLIDLSGVSSVDFSIVQTGGPNSQINITVGRNGDSNVYTQLNSDMTADITTKLRFYDPYETYNPPLMLSINDGLSARNYRI